MLNSNLSFISYDQSRYRDIILEKKQTDVPIGVLDDCVEIMFLHYSGEREAYEKWMRRRERVNFDNLIVKISQMNLCTLEHLKKFDQLDYKKKIAFVIPAVQHEIACSVAIKKYSNEERVLDDTTYFDKHISLDDFLNYDSENNK